MAKKRPALTAIRAYYATITSSQDKDAGLRQNAIGMRVWRVRCHVCRKEEDCCEDDWDWTREEFYDWLVRSEGWTFESMPGRTRNLGYCADCGDKNESEN